MEFSENSERFYWEELIKYRREVFENDWSGVKENQSGDKDLYPDFTYWRSFTHDDP